MKMKTFIVLFSALILSGCSLLSGPAEVTFHKEKILTETITLIKSKYPFLSFKKINPDSLQAVYLKKIDEYDGDGVSRLLYDLLHELRDGHVTFMNSGGMNISTYTPPRFDKALGLYDPSVVRNYFAGGLKLAGQNRIEYGRANSIGYIYFPSMMPEPDDWINAYPPILQELADTKGLIIDVRGNGGGSDFITSIIIQCLISSPFLGPLWLDATGTPINRGTFYPSSIHYTGRPIVLLQNGMCFSSTEGFISTMRELPNITTVGDTTGGGSAAPRDFLISDRFVIHLSTMAQLTYEGKFIEWNGIEPGILVVQTKDALAAGHDLQLEKAFAVLKEQTGGK